MRINISTRELEAFLALTEIRHFTHAAERCHLSQPAFSQAIQRIEQEAGVRLFARSTRNVALTPEGEVFAESVRRIAADIQDAFSDLAEHAARKKGRVSFAALPSLAAGKLAQIIAEYRSRYPNIAIDLFDVLSDRCLALLREGRVEFALTVGTEDLREFDAVPLYRDGFYVVCHRNHPLAGKKKVCPGQLADSHFIQVRPGGHLPLAPLLPLVHSPSVRQDLEKFIRNSPRASSGVEVEQLATLAALMVNGLGLSLVPETTLSYFERDDLRAIPLEAPGLACEIVAVKRKGRSLSLAAQGMFDLVEKRLSKAVSKRRTN